MAGDVAGAQCLDFIADASSLGGIDAGDGTENVFDGAIDGYVALDGRDGPLEIDDTVRLIIEGENLGKLGLCQSGGKHSRGCCVTGMMTEFEDTQRLCVVWYINARHLASSCI